MKKYIKHTLVTPFIWFLTLDISSHSIWLKINGVQWWCSTSSIRLGIQHEHLVWWYTVKHEWVFHYSIKEMLWGQCSLQLLNFLVGLPPLTFQLRAETTMAFKRLWNSSCQSADGGNREGLTTIARLWCKFLILAHQRCRQTANWGLQPVLYWLFPQRSCRRKKKSISPE